MKVEISRSLLQEIEDDVRSDISKERCGLLLGAGPALITAFQAVENVHTSPENSFEMEHSALIAAHRREREGGAQVLGHYHSHPSGQPVPSEEDARQADVDGRYWMIFGQDSYSLWQTSQSGVHLGRFNPLNLIVTD